MDKWCATIIIIGWGHTSKGPVIALSVSQWHKLMDTLWVELDATRSLTAVAIGCALATRFTP